MVLLPLKKAEKLELFDPYAVKYSADEKGLMVICHTLWENLLVYTIKVTLNAEQLLHDVYCKFVCLFLVI